jgi:hypothetical protein
MAGPALAGLLVGKHLGRQCQEAVHTFSVAAVDGGEHRIDVSNEDSGPERMRL